MICSFNSSATGCQTTSSHVLTTRLFNQNISDFITPSPQTETSSSHVVTTRPLNQSSSDFFTPSPQTETTISHVTSFTTRPFHQSISNRDSTPPLPPDETNSSPDATSTQVTSSIDPTKATNNPRLILAAVIVSLLFFFGMVVATIYFLCPCKIQGCCLCRNGPMNNDLDLEMQPYVGPRGMVALFFFMKGLN